MKTIILILSLVIITNLNLFGNSENYPKVKEIENIKTVEDMRLYRFSKKPTYSYKNDTDSDIIGNVEISNISRKNKKRAIQRKIKETNQQPKFKSTYLDFTILQEENIS
jgi:hypothetical protein